MGIDVVRRDGKFQLWEATFSHLAVPVSPPRVTPESLAVWMTARLGRSYADSFAAVERGWMPSLPGAIDKEATP